MFVDKPVRRSYLSSSFVRIRNLKHFLIDINDETYLDFLDRMNYQVLVKMGTC